MIKKSLFISTLILHSFLSAEILEIEEIEAVRPYISENGLYLFDIDDTLIDNQNTLGSPPWRSWAKSKLPKIETDFVLYDALTLYIAKSAPYKPVENATVELIQDLQSQGEAVFAFTSRGRSEWYTSTVEGVDRFTQTQLEQAGIDFRNTTVPKELEDLEEAYFDGGIIFAQHIKKGDLLKHLFKDLNYIPSLIVFVDDKLDQVQSVEVAAKEAGIPFMGFWYRRSEVDRKNFDPLLANIQLEALLLNDTLLSDKEVQEQVRTLQYLDPKVHFQQILEAADLEKIRPHLP